MISTATAAVKASACTAWPAATSRRAVGWQKLQRFNRVADPRRLAPGRELRVPVAWLRAEASVATVAFSAARRSA